MKSFLKPSITTIILFLIFFFAGQILLTAFLAFLSYSYAYSIFIIPILVIAIGAVVYPVVSLFPMVNDPSALSATISFWSGQSFDEPGLQVEGTFKAAQARYTSRDQINTDDLKRWLKKTKEIQWDYKNIVKRRGILERLK